MKKLLFAIIALSLIFGTSLALAEDNNTGNEKLEKISSPTEISKFQNIMKRGKELYGVRKQALEKITSPDDIANFKNIVKKGRELFGIRKAEEQNLVRPEALTCVKQALDKRDATLKAGIATGNTNLITTLETRTACQKSALDKTTIKEQREANKLCLEAYKKTMQTGREIVKKTQEEVWKTLKNDLKTCGRLQKAAGGAEEIKLEDGGLGIEL